MGALRKDGCSEMPRVKIDTLAAMELTSWANALHVTEQELAHAVEIVGNEAREIIPYVLMRAGRETPVESFAADRCDAATTLHSLAARAVRRAAEKGPPRTTRAETLIPSSDGNPAALQPV